MSNWSANHIKVFSGEYCQPKIHNQGGHLELRYSDVGGLYSRHATGSVQQFLQEGIQKIGGGKTPQETNPLSRIGLSIHGEVLEIQARRKARFQWGLSELQVWI